MRLDELNQDNIEFSFVYVTLLYQNNLCDWCFIYQPQVNKWNEECEAFTDNEKSTLNIQFKIEFKNEL